MRELKKIYRTTIRDDESQVVVDAMFIPKALLHDEVRDQSFKAIRPTARPFELPVQERETKHHGEGGFAVADVGHALNIKGFEVVDKSSKALWATARAFELPMQESEPKHYGKGKFSHAGLAGALNITEALARDLFDREDLIVSEMSDPKLRSIAALVASGVTIGTLAAASGPIVLLYCAGGMLVMGIGVLAVGGPLKWLGFI
jgi:hypothetical protein